MTRYFLDTSAQIERHAGDAPTRQTINELLDGETHATSTHVRREWKRTMEDAAIAILNAQATGASSFDGLLSRLAQGWGRSPGQRMRVLSVFMRGQKDTDPALIDLEARMFLRSRSEVLFAHRIDTVRDGSQCQLAREQAQEDRHGHFRLLDKCKKDECQCRQDQFLEEHRSRVADAADALTAREEPLGHRRLGRKAQEVMTSVNMRDRKGINCWGSNGTGGDISIALECADHETLLTTDSSFETIGPALNIAVERIRPTPPP